MSISLVGYDVIISWNEVTQNTIGNHIVPDYYFVYFNGSGDVNGQYYFLGLSSNTDYTHHWVGLAASNMFYKVKAVKLYREDNLLQDIFLRDIVYGMPEIEVKKILDRVAYGMNIVEYKVRE